MAMADAVAANLPGSLCAIRVEFETAAPISAYPHFPLALASALNRVEMSSIRQTLQPAPVARLSADAAWTRLIESCDDSRTLFYRAAPIFCEKRLTGLVINLFEEGRQTSEKLLESWAQFGVLNGVFVPDSAALNRHGPLCRWPL